MRFKIVIALCLVLLDIFFSSMLLAADQETPVISTKPPPADTTFWDFHRPATPAETTLVAFSLQGPQFYDQISIPDLDIVVTPENKRRIPLLRLLRALEVPGQIQADTLHFRFETQLPVIINLIQNELEINGKVFPIALKIGSSDVTNQSEIYIDVNIFKLAFGLDYQWDDLNLSYKIKIESDLKIFEKLRPQTTSALAVKVKRITQHLVETEPSAQANSQQLVSFVGTELNTEYDRYGGVFKGYRTTVRPATTFWGHVLNGDYQLKLLNDINYPDPQPQKISGWLDSGTWTSKKENTLVNIGDTNFGFSDLVAPSVNLFGTSVKWLPKMKSAGSNTDNKSFLNSYQSSFLSTGIFEGDAPLGSKVDLFINNRLINSKTVQEVGEAVLGYGHFRFEGVGLLERSLNDVKFLITHPDGTVEEYHREVLGSNQLLPRGQWAYTAGAGTHKEKNNGAVLTRGEFLGAQALYGLRNWLSVGVSAAAQNKFATDLSSANLTNTQTAPLGYYLSPEVRARLLDHLLLKGDLGLNYSSSGIDPTLASKLDLEYVLKKIKLESLLFSFDPKYSNGVTTISDRKGFSMSSALGFFKNWPLKCGFLHIQNNLNGDLGVTQQQNLLTSDLTMANILPRTSLKLLMAHSDAKDKNGLSSIGNQYTLSLENNSLKRLDVEGSYTFGNPLSSINDLTNGVPIPILGSYYSYGTTVRVNYSLDPFHTIISRYYESLSQRKIEVESVYNHNFEYNWSSRLTLGRDLITATSYAKEVWEFRMGRGTDNVFGVRAEYDQDGHNSTLGFYVTLRDLFAVDHWRLKHVTREGITPESGGIIGVVYLDMNADGHKDPNERGVPHINIYVDDYPAGETDSNGNFYISRQGNKDSATISLDIDSLPALYTPTQGMQKAYWKEGVFTKVRLGIAVLNSISGKVSINTLDHRTQNVSGAKVILLSQDKEINQKYSITADDGSFYIGEIKPGNYHVSVDPESMDQGYEIKEQLKEIIFLPRPEPTDIQNYDIIFVPNGSAGAVESSNPESTSRDSQMNKEKDESVTQINVQVE